MKNTKPISSLLVLLLIIGMGISPLVTGSAQADQVKWMKYDQALEKAKAENKHVLVNFTTSWCGWCKKMKATTYEDAEVLSTLNENFVAAKVDGDSYDMVALADGKITEKGLTRQFGVTGYPTTWFLEPDGSHIAPAPGYVDATAMNYILDYVSSDLNEAMAFSDYIQNRKKLESIRPEAPLKPGLPLSEVKTMWGYPEEEHKISDGQTQYIFQNDQSLVFADGILIMYREVPNWQTRELKRFMSFPEYVDQVEKLSRAWSTNNLYPGMTKAEVARAISEPIQKKQINETENELWVYPNNHGIVFQDGILRGYTAANVETEVKAFSN